MEKGVIIKVYIAITSGDKILLTQDVDGDAGWKFPGGHVDENELIKNAALREIKEEINLDIKLVGLFLIEDYFKSTRPDEHHQKVFLVAEPLTDNVSLKSDEVKKAQWFSKQELSNLSFSDIYPAHTKAFRKFIETDWQYCSIEMLI